MIKTYKTLFILMVMPFMVTAQQVTYDYIPDASYEEIEDRLSCIDSEMPLNFNERVKAFVDYFTVRDREYTRKILKRVENLTL